MWIPNLMRAVLAAGLLLGIAGASPAAAANAAWSPRSADLAGHVWTRAGWIRVAPAHAELAPAQPERRHAAPPYATTRPSSFVNRFFSEPRTERQSPSRDRAQLARTVLARLRTTAMPDRRARSAALAALAGIFYEAHAPPLLS